MKASRRIGKPYLIRERAGSVAGRSGGGAGPSENR
jgi:hypothetical protein